MKEEIIKAMAKSARRTILQIALDVGGWRYAKKIAIELKKLKIKVR